MIKDKFNKIKDILTKDKKKTVMISLVGLAIISSITATTMIILQNNNNKPVNSLNNSSSEINNESFNIDNSSEDNISSSEISSSGVSSNAESQDNNINYPGNSSVNQSQNNNVTSSKVNNTQTQNKPSSTNTKPQNSTNNASSKNNAVQNQAPTNQRTWQYMEILSRETFNLMNQFRQQHGVAPLKWNETCNARAKKIAENNARKKVIYHEGGQIALNNGTGTAQSFINQWANSEGHKNYMIDKGNDTKTDGAVAVYKDSEGWFYVVADLTNDFWG